MVYAAWAALAIGFNFMSTEKRDITFTYVPKVPCKTVHVVGEFNQWNSSQFPMQLQADGKTWKGNTSLEPGIYRYLFLEDSKRWLPDPKAKKVLDANSNQNSLLIVQPASYDRRPGKRGDGIITKDVLRHRPDISDTVRQTENSVSLQLRTRADDVRAIEIRLLTGESPQRIAMQKIESDPLYDYWRGKIELPKGTQSFEYSFALLDEATSRKVATTEMGPYRQSLSDYALPSPPKWLNGQVFYQIFPDRFADGDPESNEKDHPVWGADPKDRRFFGGDLVGIQQHLSHLKELGVEGLYLTPVFKANSYHAYDTVDYTEVDPRFGTNQQLAELVKAAKDAGIRTVLDAVFNHSAVDFFAFKDLRENGESSRYKDWYTIYKFPLEVKDGQQTYLSWAGVKHMPKLNQDNPETRDYFLQIGQRWIREAGIAGWRLDVANEVSHDFWRDFRKAVRAEDPDSFIVGENWLDAHEWLQGDQHDSVMNYRWRTFTLDFVQRRISAATYAKSIAKLQDDYPESTLGSMFNLLGSHDTPRLRTLLQNDRAAERLAYGLLLSYPGIPCIYYGDEVGMEGGHDPDCRKCFDWTGKTWDQGFLKFMKNLISARNGSPALRRGNYRPVDARAKEGLFSFERQSDGQTVRVVANQGKRDLRYPIPEGYQVYFGEPEYSKTQVLRPMEFVWLIRHEAPEVQ